MRKSSKALSLILSGLMATSCFSMAAVSASAAEVDSDAAGAKWVTAQERLDAGHQLVFFQFPDTVWGSNSNVKYNKTKHTTNVCCDYYAIYGANTEIKGASWQAPSTSTFKDSSDSSLYYFDLTTGGRGEIEEGADYGILFSTQANKGQAGLLQPNADGYQTCDLYFNSDCLGQTWVIDIPAVTRENTANSQKIDYYGHSQNNISQPIKKISTLCAYIDGIHPGGAPNGLELANGLKTYLPNPVNEPSFIWSKIQPTLEKFNTTAEEVYQCYVDKYAEDYNKGEHYEHVDGKDDLKADGTLKDCYRYTHYITTEVDEGTGVAVEKDNKFPDFDLVRERLNLPDEQPVQIIDDVDLATTTDFSPGQPVPAATAFESNDERYTVQNVTITPADETFAYGTVYTLTYEAVAADGYAFDESTGCGLTNNFPDSAAAMEISSAINDGVLTVTVTMTMPEEPTTEEPTTEEPTTEEPTTEEPTTEEPTTEAPETVCVVAGSPADIFGTAWDAANEANTMTKAEDGTFTKEFTVDKAYDAVQLKTVVDGADWIGDKTGNNVTFNVTGAGTFTVIYHPATEGEDAYTEVVGDNVQFDTNLDYETVFAVGNGEGYWLNGAAWDPAFAQNEMTQVSEDVWEIEFTNVPDGFERQIKFAVDGAWTHNFGGAFEDSGVTSDAVYNGDNITFDTDATCTVKAQLDLTNFDYTTKEGAKFTVTITYDEDDKEVVGMIGDVNGDGEITIDDATLIQRRAVELEVFSDVQEQLADVNGDGRISILDVTCVQKYLAEFADGKGNTGKTLWSDGTISVG